jgi:DAK2 domain fusion protein YloV
MKRTPNGSSGTPVAQFGEKGGSPSGLVRPGADPGRAASLVSRPMSTVTSLTPADLRALISGYADALADHRETINRLNVYPVPDGDTGTNMALTLSSVVAELDGATHDLDATCHAISHGSLMGARGNSGVILSQILRGLAGVMREASEIDGATVADALDAAATAAYGAVMRPVEGTILTVARVAAEGGRCAADAGADLLGVLEAAHEAGSDALARTPEMLQVLADAGVVDSGGTGLMLLFDVALNVVDGRPVPTAVEDPVGASPEFLQAFDAAHGPGSHGGSLADLRFEVMYFLDAPDDSIPGFKDHWATLGDSIVVVGGDGLWNCHVHTDDIGAAIEAAVEIGRPRGIRVTDLLEEVEEERWVREAEPHPTEPATVHEPVPCAVVAVSVGDGVRRIFQSLGVQVVVTGGQTMNPSTAQLLEAVEAAPAPDVVILPNNRNIIPVAEQVDAMTSKTVRVVPTRGVAEGFASLLAYDPGATAGENSTAMTSAAAHVVAGEITRAVRDSSSERGAIREDDWLGIAREGIIAIDDDLSGAATTLLDQLVGPEHEIVTIIEGEGATAVVTRHLEVWLHDNRPDCDVEVHHGGQPLYPYLFGIE